MQFGCRGLLIVGVWLGGAALASASTVGYWRFEGDSTGFVSDSSGNGLTLSLPGGAANPTQYPLPGSGAGSAFPTTIPQNSLSNAAAAQFTGSSNTRFTRADSPVFNATQFTVEAFINGSDFATGTSYKTIAGHWNGSGNQRSWLVAAGNTTSSFLTFGYSTDGTGNAGFQEFIGSSLSLVANHDYYVAVSVDMSDTSVNGIKFYAQDLTAGTPMQTDSRSHSYTTLFDSSTSFTIGATAQPSSPFTGLIDEVRYSDAVLQPSELLAVPEPSTFALLALGLAGLAVFWRRGRRR